MTVVAAAGPVRAQANLYKPDERGPQWSKSTNRGVVTFATCSIVLNYSLRHKLKHGSSFPSTELMA
jgi:hypothetical protein